MRYDPDGRPIPPADLMFRVSGGIDPGPFLQSGRESVEDFAAVLASLGRTYADFDHMLDFGCGCGRVLRWLVADRPTHISGTDIDAPAVQWVLENMPGVDARTNEGLPPLEFADQTFDLVIGYSIFSHLDETYQDRWLSELRRVTKPGAIVLLTVQGAFNWAYSVEHPLKAVPELEDMKAELHAKGFLFWKNTTNDGHFPEFYQSTWHRRTYVEAHWRAYFDVLDVREAAGRPTQDIVVLQRRDELPRPEA